jgi:hypothetical protein
LTPLPAGERNGQSKLSAASVRDILASPFSSRTLAPIYGVNQTTIARVRRRQHWSHVDV